MTTGEIAALATTDDPARFYRESARDVSPTTDDRPFFFQSSRLRDLHHLRLDGTLFYGSGDSVLAAVLL